jgi:hypothetical protein
VDKGCTEKVFLRSINVGWKDILAAHASCSKLMDALCERTAAAKVFGEASSMILSTALLK